MGDSISQQMFFSTGCLLEAAACHPRWAEVEWRKQGTLPRDAKPHKDGFSNMIDSNPNKGGVGALHRKCVLVALSTGDVRMCAVFVSPHELLTKFPQLLRRIAGRAQDTVVMNFGVRCCYNAPDSSVCIFPVSKYGPPANDTRKSTPRLRTPPNSTLPLGGDRVGGSASTLLGCRAPPGTANRHFIDCGILDSHSLA